MKRRFVAAAVTVGLAVSAASGCGGDGGNVAREWASGVCSSIGEWRGDVQATVQELQSDPAAISIKSLRTAADDTLASTEALLEELRGLGTPDTESGQEAGQKVEALLQSLLERLERVRAAAAGAGGSVLAVLGSVAAEVQGAEGDAHSTLGELQALAGDLGEAFRDEEPCSSLLE